MQANGIPREFAERVFNQIRGFGEYGFPESHARQLRPAGVPHGVAQAPLPRRVHRGAAQRLADGVLRAGHHRRRRPPPRRDDAPRGRDPAAPGPAPWSRRRTVRRRAAQAAAGATPYAWACATCRGWGKSAARPSSRRGAARPFTSVAGTGGAPAAPAAGHPAPAGRERRSQCPGYGVGRRRAAARGDRRRGSLWQVLGAARRRGRHAPLDPGPAGAGSAVQSPRPVRRHRLGLHRHRPQHPRPSAGAATPPPRRPRPAQRRPGGRHGAWAAGLLRRPGNLPPAPRHRRRGWCS